MLGGELDARNAKVARHQIDEGVVRLGQVQVDGVHHLLRGVRASHGQHAGVHLTHHVAAIVAGAGAQATSNDNPAVLGQRLADGVQAFLDGVINETAGVDDDQVSAVEGLGGFVTLGAQLREDQLGIGQRLGAAQADKSDFGCFRGGQCFAHIPVLSQFRRRTGGAADSLHGLHTQ